MKTIRAMLVLLGLFALAADAQTVPPERTLTWVPGLEYESGGTFDESLIQSYNLYCDGAFVFSFSNDFGRSIVVDVVLLGEGDHTCGLSETVDGIESVMSNTVSFPLGRRTPRPPTLSVQ